MNNCLCESCCGKDYCLFYQDYKNPDGIVVEPITACGRYKKLHTVEDTYTKYEVVVMLEDLKKEMNIIKECEHQIYRKEDWNFVGKCQDIIQQKINALTEGTDDR